MMPKKHPLVQNEVVRLGFLRLEPQRRRARSPAEVEVAPGGARVRASRAARASVFASVRPASLATALLVRGGPVPESAPRVL